MHSRALLITILWLLSLLIPDIAAPQAIAAQSAADTAGTVPVVISTSMPPLGLVAASLTPEQRLAYAAQVVATQDMLAREVAARGGTVVMRFSHAGSGLAALIDPTAVVRLAGIGGVGTIRPVGNYDLAPGLAAADEGSATLQQLGVSGRGATIAVIDSGIDYTHQALGGSGTVAAYNEAYATNTTIGDNLNFPNARVQGGFDYVGESWPSGPLAPDPDPIDRFGHGTAVAAIAAGSAPAAPGIAPAATLYAFKACSAVSNRCNGLALLQAVDAALDLDGDVATLDPATVIVLALSSAYGQGEDDLAAYVDIAAAMGSVVVASAGSGGDKPYSIGAPSTADGAISVGASSSLDPSQQTTSSTLNSTSARGPRLADGAIKPDLVAFSSNRAATVGTGNGSEIFRGASSAVAVVAGAAALLYEKYGAQLTPAGYRALLMNTASPAVQIVGGGSPDSTLDIGLRTQEGRSDLNLALRNSNRGLSPQVLIRCVGGGGEVLDPQADTFINEFHPKDVNGYRRTIRIDAEGTLPIQRFALLRFPRPSCNVLSAELQIEVINIFEQSQTGPIEAYDVTGNWSESTGWDKRITLGAQVSRTQIDGLGLYRLDLSALAQAADRSFDVALRTANELSIIFRSRESRAVPRLLLACTDGTPLLLHPSIITYIDEQQPATAFFQRDRTRVSSQPKRQQSTLLRFVSPDCEVTTAQLQFETLSLYETKGTLVATRIVGPWDQNVQWNTRPQFSDTLGETRIARPGLYSINVISLFRSVTSLAPITAQGAGQVDIPAALTGETLAWQSRGAVSGATPSYSETASISFGYQAVTASYSETRQIQLRNLGSAARTYTPTAEFRYSNDADRGVVLAVSPLALTLLPGGAGIFSLTVQVNASGLRPWALNSGSLGATGGNATSPLSPSLTLYEYDGFVTIHGGERNIVRLPWQILPKRAADPQVDLTPRLVALGASGAITIENLAVFQPVEAEVFALTEQSPNIYSYTVGAAIGANQSPSDLKEIGVRARTGENGLLVEFAATVYDQPYRAAQYPVRIDVLVDTDRDGVDDALVFTDDRNRDATDGRSAVFLARPITAEPIFIGFVDRDFNSQNWIIPVPAAALGISSGTPFVFQVRTIDNSFPPAPGTVVYDRSDRMTFQIDAAAFRPDFLSGQIAPGTTSALGFTVDAAGLVASSSQQGLLLLYRQAPIGRESASVLIEVAEPVGYPPPP